MSPRTLQSVAAAVVLTAMLVAAAGCLRPQPREDVFEFGPLAWGAPMSKVKQVFGDRLRPPSEEKVRGFQLPPYRLAAVVQNYMVGTTPYEIYFVQDQAQSLRKVIMLTKSDQPLTAQAEEVRALLQQRYGQPAETGQPSLAGVSMVQTLWQAKGMTVTLADVVRDKTGHVTPVRPDAAGRPGDNPHPRDIDYSLFVMYEQTTE